MSDIVRTAFNLERAPFGKDVDPDELWLDDTHNSSLERLLDVVSNHQHALVVGEPGVGKTTVMRALQARLSPVHYRPVYVAQVTLAPRDFYRQVCRGLGVEAKATAAALFDAIQGEVRLLHHEHRAHPILVLDECQLMPDRTLSHLHVLANFAWDSQPLLSLILVGLPELHDRLRLGIHRSLLTRLSAKIELPPTTSERTAAYVRHRVSAAGSKAELFTPDGLTTLHELTGGLLRSVDIIAHHGLRLAAQRDVKLVDRDLVLRAYRQTPLL